MKICEILSVGTELLLGDIIDTNAAYLSQKMKEAGFAVYFRQTCGDNRQRLKDSLHLAFSRSDLVIITGGLGPTYDDITREVCAEYCKAPLQKNIRVEEKLKAFFLRCGIKMTENNLRQALVPEGAKILENDWGTAPGLQMEKDGKILILLPGVPYEMKMLFTYRVLPFLQKMTDLCLKTEVLKLYGISESELDDILAERMRLSKNPTVAPYAKPDGVELHITASASDEESAASLCRQTGKELALQLKEYCYALGEVTPEEALVTRFGQNHITVATAESCTGGLVSRRITSVPGSSKVFSLGICSYSEESKKNILNVPGEILERDGVYSKACALAMAKGVRDLAGSDVGIGITGIAGPEGGTEQDPVGCVYLAVVSSEKECVERVVFGHNRSDRQEICRRASTKALMMALKEMGQFCIFS